MPEEGVTGILAPRIPLPRGNDSKKKGFPMPENFRALENQGEDEAMS